TEQVNLMLRDPGTIQTLPASRKVCVTGQLATMTHAELASLVESSGGTFLPGPRRTGFLIVVGGGKDSASKVCLTRSFRRAHRLRTCGYPVQILTEDEFLQQTGIPLPARRLLRLGEQLLDSSGQRYFDFSAEEEQVPDRRPANAIGAALR